jgi:hypothetical protein
MTIKPWQDSEKNRSLWDQWVTDANNGTLFHTLRFLAYHAPDRFKNHHLCVYKRNTLFAVMPGAEIQEDNGLAFVSYPGASYGGLVVSEDCRFEDVRQLVDRLIEYTHKAGFSRINLTLPPMSYYRTPHQTLDFALICAGFQYRKRELTNIVSLDKPIDQILPGLPGKTRADIRQAIKTDVRIEWIDDPPDEMLSVMYDMLLENRRDLGLDSPPTHTLSDLSGIRDLNPGELLLGIGYAEETPVSTTLVFRCNRQALLTFYICHDRQARDRHPVHYLLYDLICEGTRQQYRMLDFGISTINMVPLNSLIRFKESFRAQHFFRDTFELKL